MKKQTIYIYPKSKIEPKAHYALEPAQGEPISTVAVQSDSHCGETIS